MLSKQSTLFILCLSLFTGSLFGQSATVSIPCVDGDPGETICVPITVADFSDFVQLGFSITWDENDLAFVNIQNINPALNDFSVFNDATPPFDNMRGINTGLTSAGGLTAYWEAWPSGGVCDDLSEGLDLPDDAVLFEICFEVLGTGGYGALYPIEFFGSPQPLVANKYGSGGCGTTNVPFFTENGCIVEGVVPLILTTDVPDGNFQPGDLICVDIVATSGFNNMQGLQFGLDWDQSILQVESVQPNTDIPNNISFIYNVDQANNCFSVSWSFTNDTQGVTLDDGTVFAAACFTITGDCSDQTDIEVSASCNGAQTEATNSTIQTLPVVTESDRLRIDNCNQFGLDVIVECPGPVNVGNNICIEVQAGDNYSMINSYEYLFLFDETILEFTGLQNFLTDAAINANSDFDTDNVSNGVLGIDIDHTPFVPLSAAPGDVIYEACFDVIGYSPSTPITISDPSTVNESSPDLIIGIDPTNCAVDIVQPTQVIMNIGDVDAGSDGAACLPVTVSNFDNITDISFTMQFDDAAGMSFDFVNLISNALPGATVTPVGSGLFTFQYSGAAVTIPDGDLLFELCIQATADAVPDTCSSVSIVPFPLVPTAMSEDATIQGIVSNPGEACVLFPEGFGLIVPDVTAEILTTVCLPIEVVSFDNITGAEFQFNFSPSDLEYQGVFLDGSWTDLEVTDFDDSNAGIGLITVSWSSAVGPVAIPDGSVVFEMCFNVLDNIGCFNLDASSQVSPSATTTAGDGSIVFTDGEICVENRIVVLDKISIPTPCADECEGMAVFETITGEEDQDVFIRRTGLGSVVFSGDTIRNLCPGMNYFELFTGDGELFAIDSIMIEVDASLAAMADAGDDVSLSCNTGGVLISGNNNEGDTWDLFRLNGGVETFITNGVIAGNTFNTNITAGGTYILIVTNENGCTARDTVIVSDPIIPVAEAGPETATLTCENPTLMLDGMGSSTEGVVNYLWEQIDVMNDPIMTISNTMDATITMAGRYRLTVTFPQSQCSTSDIIVVSDDTAPPNIDIPTTFTLGCDGSPAFIDAGPLQEDFTYLYEPAGGGPPLSVTPTYTTSNLGFIMLTVTDTTNQCVTTLDIEIIESQGNPIINDTLDQPLNCNSDTIQLMPNFDNVSGSQTYSWTTMDGAFVVGQQDDANPLVIGQGTYTLVVDDSGCSSTATIQVVEPVLPIADAGEDMNIECGQTFTIDGSGSQSDNATYLWYTLGDTIDGETNNTLIVDQPGEYIIEVLDLNTQCRAFDTIEVLPAIGFPTVMLPDTVFGLTCANGSLVIDPMADGGDDQVTLSISGPGAPTADATTVTVFEPGQYVLTVENQVNGCSADFMFLVDGSEIVPPFAAVNVGIQTLTCVEPTATISATQSSSGPNFTYMWDNVQGGEVPGAQFQGTDTLVVSTPGLYELTVINTETMCESYDTVLIQDGRSFPQVDTLPYAPIDCENTSTTLSISIADTSGLFIQWFGPPVGDPPVSLIATNVLTIDVEDEGSYIAVVVDQASSCITQVGYDLFLDDEGIDNIVFEPVDSFSCSSGEVTIDASASTELVDEIDISWESLDGNTITPANGSLIVSVDGPGSYVLTLSTGAECTNSDTIVVEAANDTPVADLGEDFEIECGEMPLLENMADAPAQEIFSYTWTSLQGGTIVTGQDTPNAVVSGIGTYELLVTNLQNLCEDRDTIVITLIGQEPAMLPFDFSVCDDSTTVAGNLPAGTFGSWEILNDGGAVITFEDTLATIIRLDAPVTLAYTLSANGCEDYSSDTITISRALAPVANDDEFVILGNDGVGTLNLLENDQQNGPVTVAILDSFPFGEVISLLNGELTFDAGQGVSGEFTVNYEICSESCGVCDTAAISFRIDADGQRPPVYNTITPNGDGLNEFLIFDLLDFQAEDFPDNSLIIFNRWGDILYEAAPYNNDWDGRNQSGNELPEGTYYYILRLDLGEGDIIRGDITILR
ncbi:hypothetical protein CEQ90_03575 [Lewinellaceae bacterium SD302]|nr:hypothetical protein CEQ90_03575 [Lewinellaceae bacterium SD302]